MKCGVPKCKEKAAHSLSVAGPSETCSKCGRDRNTYSHLELCETHMGDYRDGGNQQFFHAIAALKEEAVATD